MELAGRLGVEEAPAPDLIRALSALQRVEQIQGESPDLLVRQVEVIRYLVEPMTDRREAARWARRGEILAFHLRQIAPARVEGYYYTALFLGFRAQNQRSVALLLLPRMEEEGRRAVSVDETYDDAGPLRFMGMLLIRAPAWPHGIGDTEEGVELLQRAVEIDDYPLNRLFLAQALIANGEAECGCEELAVVLDAPAEGRWARTRARWLREAEQVIDQNRCPRADEGIADANEAPSM
jgi:hypothetical protein